VGKITLDFLSSLSKRWHRGWLSVVVVIIEKKSLLLVISHYFSKVMCLTAKASYRKIHFTLQEMKAERHFQVFISGSNISLPPPPAPYPPPVFLFSLILRLQVYTPTHSRISRFPIFGMIFRTRCTRYRPDRGPLRTQQNTNTKLMQTWNLRTGWNSQASFQFCSDGRK
jgi:hypothetical protein